jgi:hypothetical protein
MISSNKTLALIASLIFVCIAASLPTTASASPATAELMERALSGDRSLHKSGQPDGPRDLPDAYEAILNRGTDLKLHAIGAAGSMPGASGASSSRATHRKKRKRKMPIKLALSTTKYFVKQLYLESLDEVSWDSYGAGNCRRMSRPNVRCVYYLTDDVYDDYDTYLDTILCGGFTYTYFNWRNKPKFKAAKSQCFLESEI